MKVIKNLQRVLNDYKSLYPALLWKKQIISDYFHAVVFKSKVKASTPFGFDLVTRNYITNRLMLKGAFENSELEILKNSMLNSDVFVDVGANIGYYSCLALSLGKHVVAVEPQQQNLECLFSNISSNGWFDAEVFPLGLSDKPGLLTLYGASGPCASLVKGWAGYSSRFKQFIPVNTMDNILGDRFMGKKLLIKIDVEGAEYDVLRGAMKTLSMQPKPNWFIEISPSLFHPGGLNRNFEATFDLFWKNGYEVRIANTEKRLVTPADITLWMTDKGVSVSDYNYLMVPENSEV